MFTLGTKVEFSDSDEVATVVEIRYHKGQQCVLLQKRGFFGRTASGLAWYSADDERLLIA